MVGNIMFIRQTSVHYMVPMSYVPAPGTELYLNDFATITQVFKWQLIPEKVPNFLCS